jgi:hypothetical protein
MRMRVLGYIYVEHWLWIGNMSRRNRNQLNPITLPGGNVQNVQNYKQKYFSKKNTFPMDLIL